MIQHHISTKNKPPPQAELIPSVSHPNQNSSVKKASLLTPVLPTYHLPRSLQWYFGFRPCHSSGGCSGISPDSLL